MSRLPRARLRTPAVAALLALLGVAIFAVAGGSSSAATTSSFTNKVFASAVGIMHTTPKGKEQITQPDDITALGGLIYVAFQNGVGSQGEPSSTGNLDSTVVAFGSTGKPVHQWDLVGKCDGLTADPQTGQIVATVNEDYKSSIYLISPTTGPKHFKYSTSVLAHRGGTDAISVVGGTVFVSASAPGTTGLAAPQASDPALYSVSFNASTGVATLKSVFTDEATATEANTTSPQYKQPERLYLTDPDSSELVPTSAARFGGDFMLTSQGDLEQIFASGIGTATPALSVLQLSASVDDTAWPTAAAGKLYNTDSKANAVDVVTGPFVPGTEIAAVTPCNSNFAPSTCPAPGYPANYLGRVNPDTGVITAVPVTGASSSWSGVLFAP
jgi:hypothetical protein